MPVLGREDFETIGSGAPLVLVHEVESAGGGDSQMGVYGFQIVEEPRLLVWVATIGTSLKTHPRYNRVVIERDDQGAFLKYQHINVPWPFKDRHWIIDVSKNIALAENSDGVIWEHRWSLAEDMPARAQAAYDDGMVDGVTPRQFRKSLFLPENKGAWVAFQLDPQRTLLVAYAAADLGGNISRGMAMSFAKRKLAQGLGMIAERSANVHERFGEISAVYDGYGRLITEEAARQAANVPQSPAPTSTATPASR